MVLEGERLWCWTASMEDGRPRTTVTLARTATASLAERRARAPPLVEAAVETVSAAEALANVAEYGPNYVLPQAAESKTARR